MLLKFSFKRMLPALILCTSLPVFAEEPPVRIAVIGPTTGKSSEDMGESIRGGARVFLSDINQFGGVLGRRVELVERDDEAKPEVGARIARELVDKEKVVAVVGFGNTGVALPAAKIFQEARIPLIISGATGAVINKQLMPPASAVSYVFRTSASDALQPIVILNDLIDRRKITKIALLHDETPYGQSGKQSVLDELARRHLAPVTVASFKVGEQDMSSQLAQAREAGAQAVVLYCLATEGAMVAKSAARMKLKLPIVGPWTLSQKSFIDLSADSGEGVRTAVTYIENDISSVSNQFTLAYKKTNKVSLIPSAVAAAQTYDALRLIILAIYQARSTDGDKIRAALEDLHQTTMSTVVSRYQRPFSPTDHEAISLNMIVMGEIHKGQVAYAYPEDASSGLITRVKK
ncbi:branched-chain amino acid transport system substrate-binding protein [Collimonas sp. PA-H2]|nr:branched-chain amino acid transport system substrate-binding protein [Collimonas sp. PA-H2]